MIQVKFKKLHPDATLPTRAHPGDAGLDLYAAEDNDNPRDADAVVVPTGVAAEIPPGHCALIVGRSGLAKAGLDVLGGLIDSGYRGEWRVVLSGLALTNPDFRVRRGERIAQAIILPVPAVEVVEADDLAPSDRGEGGFGSTGA